jgi:hypothetical protein
MEEKTYYFKSHIQGLTVTLPKKTVKFFRHRYSTTDEKVAERLRKCRNVTEVTESESVEDIKPEAPRQVVGRATTANREALPPTSKRDPGRPKRGK